MLAQVSLPEVDDVYRGVLWAAGVVGATALARVAARLAAWGATQAQALV